MRRTAPAGVVRLAGVSFGGHKLRFDVGEFNRGVVLENDVVFGTVNAKRRHYRAAANALAKADKTRLVRLITRRVPEDFKTLVDFTQNACHPASKIMR